MPALKKDVAERIRAVRGERRVPVRDVRRDGDARARDRRTRASTSPAQFADGTPADPDARREDATGRASLAFRDAHLEQSPFVNAMSDIDGHQVNVPGRRQPLGTFTLFDFSAKFDPVATMLVQNHRIGDQRLLRRDDELHQGDAQAGRDVLATEEGAPWVKYIHGDYGKGTWTYLGGHDPEDPQHAIGNRADRPLAAPELARATG